MPHYKAPDNSLHWLDSTDFEYLLPSGSVQITDEEAEQIRQSQLPPPAIPSQVSMGQARAALIQTGLISKVEAALAVIPGVEGDIARSDWEYRITVDRNWPLVQSLKVQLGWEEQQLDELFTLASTL